MENINHFLAMYATETIAFVIIVFFAIVILKQRKDNSKDLSFHEENVKQKAQQTNTVIPEKNLIEKEKKVSPTLVSKPIHELHVTNELIKKRREVPSHGAITKESFAIFKGSKLLVAEDNSINQKVIKGMLGDAGIEIIMANNGQEALDILKDNKDIYIVLMDAHMPLVDGFEATKQIRADRSLDHLLVVALSGDTASDDIKKMKSAGMQEYLEKPLKIDKLYDILYAYIDVVNGVKLGMSDLQTSNLLHVSDGIEICGGDSELFKEILLEFLNMYADADQKIKSFIQQADYTSANKILLDISGIAANIGATQLAEVSTQLREAIRHNERDNFIKEEQAFVQTLFTLCSEVQAYLQN